MKITLSNEDKYLGVNHGLTLGLLARPYPWLVSVAGSGHETMQFESAEYPFYYLCVSNDTLLVSLNTAGVVCAFNRQYYDEKHILFQFNTMSAITSYGRLKAYVDNIEEFGVVLKVHKAESLLAPCEYGTYSTLVASKRKCEPCPPGFYTRHRNSNSSSYCVGKNLINLNIAST